MEEKRESPEEQAERYAAASKEAWRGAWRVVFVKVPIILVTQVVCCALFDCFDYLCRSVPEWLALVFRFVLLLPLLVLMLLAFLIFPCIIEHKVNTLVNDIMKREGIGGVDVFKFRGVKTFGVLTSAVFFIFSPLIMSYLFSLFEE